MTKIEVDVLTLWSAWRELNAIRAMSGVPLDFNGTPQGIDETYFSELVSKLRDALGEHATPWGPQEK